MFIVGDVKLKLKKTQIVRNILIFVLIISIFVPLIAKPTNANENLNSEPRKLDFAILFHANQANVPYSVFANEVNYAPVLETLLNHPNLPFPLHFSGTLLTDLAFYVPETLDLLQTGIDRGQFEMVGSTYAQNIVYSLEYEYDQNNQLEKHLETLNQTLNVRPTGFWNPERCWRHSQYIPLLANHGYKYTFLEDQIIANATNFMGYEEYRIRKAISNESSVLIVDDDKTIISLMDNVAFSNGLPTDLSVVHAVDELINYLHDVYENDTNDDYLVFYGQDMEAWGLWQEEGNFGLDDDYQNVILRLDYLLDRLEAESDWLQLVTPTQFIDNLPNDYSFENLYYIPDGQADWMQIPCQNQGYNDWFDFNANNTDLQEFRNEFSKVRNRLLEITSNIAAKQNENRRHAAEELMNYAEYVYAANQYEFGCIGVEFDWFYRAKNALLSAEAANYALNPSSNLVIEINDLDLDGRDEYIMKDAMNYVVFSPNGARLLNWYNISNGDIYMANDIPNTYVNKMGTNYRAFDGLSAPVAIIEPGDQWGRNDQAFRIRPNSLYDSFSGEDSEYLWQNIFYTADIFEDSLVFNVEYSDRVISKVFSIDQQSNAVKVKYIYQNQDSQSISPRIGFSFSPSNKQMLFDGIQNIQYNSTHGNSKQIHSIFNQKTNVGVSVIFSEDSNVNFCLDTLNPMFAVGAHANLPEIMQDDSFQLEFVLKGVNSIPANGSNTDDDSDTNGRLTNRISGYSQFILLSLGLIATITLFVKQKSRK
ncbi:MAG: hypothetical protein DRO88_02080 [Promethearchaeia archaeon]|nr:MAG: hypothetical protein DRO88_02080 [Candidatus Lokiarchaeia archaeon]